MKKFVAILKSKKSGTLTKELLFKHVDHLRKLQLDGKLFICGPLDNNDQALQILKCNTVEEAKSLVNNDPFISEGYYADYELHELIEANERNNWLLDTPQNSQS